MRIAFLAASLLAVAATGAVAEPITTQFRGLRAEGNVGWDRFQSQGQHNDKFGYGGTIGFDGTINDKFLVGAEGSYWRANNWNQNVTDVGDGVVAHKSFEEWGVAARAGYLVAPDLAAYVKGGYVINEQRKAFASDLPGGGGFYNHGRTTGFQAGGGVEYTLSQLQLPVPVYVSAQYVYSGYNDHTARQRAMLGIGVRFK